QSAKTDKRIGLLPLAASLKSSKTIVGLFLWFMLQSRCQTYTGNAHSALGTFGGLEMKWKSLMIAIYLAFSPGAATDAIAQRETAGGTDGSILVLTSRLDFEKYKSIIK